MCIVKTFPHRPDLFAVAAMFLGTSNNNLHKTGFHDINKNIKTNKNI